MTLAQCHQCSSTVTTKSALEVVREWWTSQYGDKSSALFFSCPACKEENCVVAKRTTKLRFTKRIR